MKNANELPSLTKTMSEILAEFEILKKRTHKLSKMVEQIENSEKNESNKENKKDNGNVASRKPIRNTKNDNNKEKLKTQQNKKYGNNNKNDRNQGKENNGYKKNNKTKQNGKPLKKLKHKSTQTKNAQSYFSQPTKSNLPCAVNIVNETDFMPSNNLRNVQTSTTNLSEYYSKQILSKIQAIQGDSWDSEILILLIPLRGKEKNFKALIINKIYKTELGSFLLKTSDLNVMDENEMFKRYSIVMSTKVLDTKADRSLILDHIIKAETMSSYGKFSEENQVKTATIAELFEIINDDNASNDDYDELFDISVKLRFRILIRPDLISEYDELILDFFFFENYYMGTISYSNEELLKQIMRNKCILNNINFVYDIFEYCSPKFLVFICRSLSHLTKSMWLYDCLGEVVFDIYKFLS